MKKILAVMILASLALPASAFARCGSNAGRNAPTTPTASSGTRSNSPGVGIKRN